MKITTNLSGPLKTKGDALLKAAHEFWQEYNSAIGSAAVVWLENDKGHFVLFTRSEYKQTIMENVDAVPDRAPPMVEPFVFEPGCCPRDGDPCEHAGDGTRCCEHRRP